MSSRDPLISVLERIADALEERNKADAAYIEAQVKRNGEQRDFEERLFALHERTASQQAQWRDEDLERLHGQERLEVDALKLRMSAAIRALRDGEILVDDLSLVPGEPHKESRHG